MTQALYCRNDNLSIQVDRLIYTQQARKAVMLLAAVTLDCECGDFCHVPNVMCQTPPPLNVDLMLLTSVFVCECPPSVIYLFSFLGTAFMVIVQFHGCMVRQYRACVVDSIGL